MEFSKKKRYLLMKSSYVMLVLFCKARVTVYYVNDSIDASNELSSSEVLVAIRGVDFYLKFHTGGCRKIDHLSYLYKKLD